MFQYWMASLAQRNNEPPACSKEAATWGPLMYSSLSSSAVGAFHPGPTTGRHLEVWLQKTISAPGPISFFIFVHTICYLSLWFSTDFRLNLFIRGPSSEAAGILLLLFSFFFVVVLFFSAKSVWAAKTIRPRNTKLGKLVENCTCNSGNKNQTN